MGWPVATHAPQRIVDLATLATESSAASKVEYANTDV
jgi:hypothetical protein